MEVIQLNKLLLIEQIIDESFSDKTAEKSWMMNGHINPQKDNGSHSTQQTFADWTNHWWILLR